MKILHPESLIATVDAFNEAVFFDYPWQNEAEPLAAWVSARLGESKGYAGSFALTDEDWDREFRLFTGEKVTTRAARAHIIAEEATRLLTLIWKTTGLDSDARRASEERLGARIFSPQSTAATNGIYCCGKCSVSLWRCLAAGGFAGHTATLARSAATLAAARDGAGGWKRFPFYYTLLFLAEAGPELFGKEIGYGARRLERAGRLMKGKTDAVSARRLRLISVVMAAI